MGCRSLAMLGMTTVTMTRPRRIFAPMNKALSALLWVLISITGAGAFAYLALSRGESISAAWLLTAAVCTYLVGYRFYSKMIAAKVFALDASRKTAAVLNEDGRDFVPTNRWIVFGHH